MKTTTLSILCLFPIALLAQKDYCPCMDKKKDNQYIDLMDVLNQVNRNVANFDLEPSTLYPAQAQEQNQYYPPVQFTAQAIEQEPEQPEQIIQTTSGSVDIPQQQLAEKRVKLRTNSSRAAFKKAKKRRSKKLKARKKMKKYKGNCPRF